MILLIRSKVNHDGFPKCIMHESSALATRFRKLESFEIADGIKRMLSQVLSIPELGFAYLPQFRSRAFRGARRLCIRLIESCRLS